MENNIKKCSSTEHKEIDAIFYCSICKLYLCNKCEKIHKNWFQNFENHVVYKLDTDLSEIFIGLCKEENHFSELEFFCKNHNTLCCSKCITKIKNEQYGKHRDCDVYLIKDIENEKKNTLKENIKYLEDISKSLEETINDLKNIFQEINKSKDEIKNNIQKIFTKLRSVINEREDKLMIEVDKKFEESFFKEDFIKKSENLPKKIKIELEKGKKINEDWNHKSKSSINTCISIENNIKNIREVEEAINNFKSIKIKSKVIFEEEEKNKIIELINNLGKIKLNSKNFFDSEIEINQDLILKWLNNKEFKSELLFRKSRDGSDVKEWHKKCDNKGTTIIFIETVKGHKFGAYTELNFNAAKRSFLKDKSTFLFSFNQEEKYTIKENKGSIGFNGDTEFWYGSNFPEIYFKKTLDEGITWDNENAETFKIKGILTNKEKKWAVKELEVFKIIYI